MTNGETIFVTLVGRDYENVWVTEYVVLDAENKFVRSARTGDARVLHDWENVHATESEAWQQAARDLLAFAETLRGRSQECLRKAAAAGVVRVTA